MALPFKPHTVEVFAKGAAVVAGAGTSVRGQLTPVSASSSLNQWGVDLKYPHMWLCDAPDRVHFEVGGRLLYKGRVFAISAMQSYDDIAAADHCQLGLDEVIEE